MNARSRIRESILERRKKRIHVFVLLTSKELNEMEEPYKVRHALLPHVSKSNSHIGQSDVIVVVSACSFF